MSCPLCRQRKGRRDCPALGQTICPVCCGTKRLVEIDCPATCSYLTTAREHPAAVVKRQQEQDVARLLPSIQHLTGRQHELFFVLQSVIARHQPEGFARLVDSDVEEAAGAIASTLETAARGVIYEHAPQSLAAQRLGAEVKRLLQEMAERGAVFPDREVAVVLRAIERGARELRAAAQGDTAYLELMARLLQVNRGGAGTASRPEGVRQGSSLIIP